MRNIFSHKDYIDDFTVRMAHHSTAIEGNSLTQDETASIILNGIIPKKMNEREYYEVKNYKNSIPFLLKCLENNQFIDNELIKQIHAQLMANLIYNCGQFKTTQNMIVGATFETELPYKIPYILKDWCDNLNFRLTNAKNEEKLKIILEQHIKFERIHPFSDGNGRVGRFLILYSALQENLMPFVIDKQMKDEYIHALRNHDIKALCDLAKLAQEIEMDIIRKIDTQAINEIKNKMKNEDKS